MEQVWDFHKSVELIYVRDIYLILSKIVLTDTVWKIDHNIHGMLMINCAFQINWLPKTIWNLFNFFSCYHIVYHKNRAEQQNIIL